jgi:hypothetical protein
MIELAFYKGRGTIYDRLIRLWTWSRYSHVEIVVRRREKINSSLIFSSSPRDGGVRQKWSALDPARWDCVRVPRKLNRKLITDELELKAQYDWRGIIFSQIVPFGWQDKNNWFCSEICAAAIGLQNPHTYSPGALYRHVLRIAGTGAVK